MYSQGIEHVHSLWNRCKNIIIVVVSIPVCHTGEWEYYAIVTSELKCVHMEVYWVCGWQCVSQTEA